MKNQPKQPIQQCHSGDTTPSTALTFRTAKASAIVPAVVFFFAAGCGFVQTATDKEVARAACVSLETGDEADDRRAFDLLWTLTVAVRDDGVSASQFLFAMGNGCYESGFNTAGEHNCLVCLGAVARAAYGLE